MLARYRGWWYEQPVILRVSSCLVLLASLLSCSSARPPRGPHYVPSNTKEASTPCPKERQAAQVAREALLGVTDPALTGTASKQVLAHAHCEAAAALATPVPAGTHDQILSALRALRGPMYDAGNLFGEVLRYEVVADSQEALVANAKLTLGYANIVDRVSSPSELDTQEATMFRSELEEASRTLRSQASLLLQQALASEGAQSTRQEACSLLASLGASSAACEIGE